MDEAMGRTRDLAGIGRRVAAAIERRPVLVRWLLAGPGALLGGILIMAAMPVWLPAGSAGVDNIVYPIVLAPLIWSVVFMYAVLEQNLPRGVAMMIGVILIMGAVVALAVTGTIHGGGA